MRDGVQNMAKLKMKKFFAAIASLTILLLFAAGASAWEAQGAIHGTDIEYSMLELSKNGVRVRLTNTYETGVKLSLRLTFYDRTGNTIGYSLFGLREIPGDAYVDIGGNYLNGNWRTCRDAARIEWQRMTYEPLD